MKISFLMTLSLLALDSQAANFSFGGQNFFVHPMGRVLKVVPVEIQSGFSPISGDGSNGIINPDCATVASTISRREYLFKDCRATPSMPICKALVKSLRLLAEGRAELDGSPVDSTAVQKWQLDAAQGEPADRDGLRAAVAKQYKIAEEKVEIVAPSSGGAQPRLHGNLKLSLGEGSLLSKISSLLPFEEQNLGQVMEGNRFITRNNLLACDLASGNASYSASNLVSLSHLERVPDQVVDYAWKIKGALENSSWAAEQEPLVQAALIGFLIAGQLPAHPEKIDPLLAPEKIFLRLFDLGERGPVAKVFASKASMRTSAYPDEASQLSISQGWRIR